METLLCLYDKELNIIVWLRCFVEALSYAFLSNEYKGSDPVEDGVDRTLLQCTFPRLPLVMTMSEPTLIGRLREILEYHAHRRKGDLAFCKNLLILYSSTGSHKFSILIRSPLPISHKPSLQS